MEQLTIEDIFLIYLGVLQLLFHHILLLLVKTYTETCTSNEAVLQMLFYFKI